MSRFDSYKVLRLYDLVQNYSKLSKWLLMILYKFLFHIHCLIELKIVAVNELI